jgi:NCS1 family nucleobase:cation symporter-1
MSLLSRFHNLVKVEETEEQKKEAGRSWTNVDLAPNPPETRRWDSWSFFLFQVSRMTAKQICDRYLINQFSISFSPTTYNSGASLVAIGLLWWHIFLAAFVGTILCCLLVFFNARGPSWYHIGFPSFVRLSAGMRGSLLWIFIRG